MKARASIDIHHLPEDVFAFVTDVAKMPLWVTGVTASHMVSPEMGLGAHFVLEYMDGWRPYDLEVEVVDFEPGRALSLKTARGRFAFEGRMELESIDGGTRITNIIEAGPDSVATQVASKVLGPLIRPSMGRRLLRELETLSASIEADPSLKH